MMIVEDTPVPLARLPIAELRAHLRMGTGFAEDTLQDAVLEGFLRASLAAIEARTGKAVLARSVTWRVREWDALVGHGLSMAPVMSVEVVRVVDGGGVAQDIDEDVRLENDTHTPILRPMGACLPAIPTQGFAEISATVGFGTTWAEVPADMQQAVMMLAAHFYEYRHDTALRGGCMPFGVTSLIERFRPLRLSLRSAV